MSGPGIYAATALMCARAEDGVSTIVHLECTTGLFESQSDAHRAATIAAMERRPGLDVAKVEVTPVADSAVLEHAQALALEERYLVIIEALGPQGAKGMLLEAFRKKVGDRIPTEELDAHLGHLINAGLIWWERGTESTVRIGITPKGFGK